MWQFNSVQSSSEDTKMSKTMFLLSWKLQSCMYVCSLKYNSVTLIKVLWQYPIENKALKSKVGEGKQNQNMLQIKISRRRYLCFKAVLIFGTHSTHKKRYVKDMLKRAKGKEGERRGKKDATICNRIFEYA